MNAAPLRGDEALPAVDDDLIRGKSWPPRRPLAALVREPGDFAVGFPVVGNFTHEAFAETALETGVEQFNDPHIIVPDPCRRRRR